MQRRHFELIADVLRERFARELEADGGFRAPDYKLAHAFADRLALENPRFDRSRFLGACGVPPGS